MDPKLPKIAAPGRLGRAPARKDVFARRLKGEGLTRRRRLGLQPWRRGRIRPSTCRDLGREE